MGAGRMGVGNDSSMMSIGKMGLGLGNVSGINMLAEADEGEVVATSPIQAVQL